MDDVDLLQGCAELIDALPEPLLLAAADGAIVAANAPAERLLRMPRALLARRRLPLLFTDLPDPPATLAGAPTRRVHATSDKTGPLDLTVRPFAGGLLCHLAPPPSATGDATALASELAVLERLGRIGKLLWHADENRSSWSTELLRITGVGPSPEPGYAAFLARLHADDREPLLHAIARGRREGRSFCLRHRIVRPGGEVRRVVSRGCWLPREGELPQTLVLRVQDVTARHRAEEAALREAERNRLLLESTGEGIVGMDLAGRCTFVNPAAMQMLGYSREELLAAASIHDLVHHSHADGSPYPIADCPMHKAIASGEGVLNRNELLFRKGGTSFPAAYSAHPVLSHGRIEGAVVVFRDVAETHAMVAKLDYLATHDTLTGLVNRYAFEQRLGEALAQARSDGGEHILCYIDLDQFKVVNDSCGHVAGDELLRQLSILLHGRLRPADTLARLGGDEFGVLFEQTPLATALSILADLKETVQAFRFVWEQRTFALGMSAGVVNIGPHTESVAGALSAADTACYVAKSAGRNRIHVHREHDLALTRHRGEMLWASRLREALDQNRFRLRYQPIVPLCADEWGKSCEILLTLRDPEGHEVPPGAFLPAAERYNLMPEIDRWVVGRVLKWWADHPRQLKRLALCTINLSGNTLGDETSLAFIVRTLKRSGVPPERIGFEITETAAIANLADALSFMRRLSALGCRFALDDFGSGMSSFGYLKNLPVHFLKIDGSFVRDIATDRVDRAMVKAINHVGQVMNIRTIAEHLETLEALAVLREIGVDYGQGYGTGAPRDLALLAR